MQERRFNTLDIRDNVAAFLAVIAVLGFMAVFAFLCFGKVAPTNKDLFNIALMALVGWVGIAFGFYLGTSVSSAKKTEADNLEQIPLIPLKEEIADDKTD
jgi:hypothetical protein